MHKTTKFAIAVFICLAAGIPLAHARAMPATYNVKNAPYDAKGDGTSDDTSAINAALAQACADGSALYFPSGIYQVAPLSHFSNCSITLYGDGPTSSVLRLSVGAPGTTTTALLYFSGSATVLSIHDLGLEGQHLNSAGIDAIDTQSVAMNNISVKNFGTPGYAAGHRTPNDGAYLWVVASSTVTNSVFQNNERDGLETQAAHYLYAVQNDFSGNGWLGAVAEQRTDDDSDGPLNVTFASNTVSNTGGGGFDIETASGLTPVVGSIRYNTVTNSGNDQWGNGWGAVIGVNGTGDITGNTIVNFSSITGPAAYRKAIAWGNNSSPVTITGNTITGGITGIGTGDGKGHSATITNNTITGGVTAINGYNAPGVLITGNTFARNSAYGVSFDLSSNMTITGNTFYGNAIALNLTRSFGCTTTPNSYPKQITSFAFAAPSSTGFINESAKTIALTVPWGTDLAHLTPMVVFTGSSTSPAGGVVQSFASGSVPYVVSGDDGATTTYMVTVTVAPQLFSLGVTNQNGTVSTTPELASYASGTAVTVTANMNSGYVFNGWIGTYATSTNPFTFTMTGNVSLAATSSAIVATTTSQGTGGSSASTPIVSGGGGGGGGTAAAVTQSHVAAAVTLDATEARSPVVRFNYAPNTLAIVIAKTPNFERPSVLLATGTLPLANVPASSVLYIKYCNAQLSCSAAVQLKLPTKLVETMRTPFARSLSVSMRGRDVAELQRYLNGHGFLVAKSGSGAPGHESTYFGKATALALKQFQLAHEKSFTVATSGLGKLNLATRKYLNDSI